MKIIVKLSILINILAFAIIAYLYLNPIQKTVYKDKIVTKVEKETITKKIFIETPVYHTKYVSLNKECKSANRTIVKKIIKNGQKDYAKIKAGIMQGYGRIGNIITDNFTNVEVSPKNGFVNGVSVEYSPEETNYWLGISATTNGNYMLKWSYEFDVFK